MGNMLVFRLDPLLVPRYGTEFLKTPLCSVTNLQEKMHNVRIGQLPRQRTASADADNTFLKTVPHVHRKLLPDGVST